MGFDFSSFGVGFAQLTTRHKPPAERHGTTPNPGVPPPAALSSRSSQFSILRFLGMRSLGLYLALVVLLGVPATAENAIDPPGVFGLPLSNEVVEVEVHFDDGEIVRLAVREGTVFTVRTEDDYFGFSPQIDSEDEEIEFELWRIKKIPGPNGGDSAHAAGMVFAPIGEFAWAGIDQLAFDVKVRSVRTGRDFSMPRRGHPSLPDDPEELRRMSARGTCCVSTCNGSTICGCSVDSACSSCCSGGCCDLDGDPDIFQQGLIAP